MHTTPFPAFRKSIAYLCASLAFVLLIGTFSLLYSRRAESQSTTGNQPFQITLDMQTGTYNAANNRLEAKFTVPGKLLIVQQVQAFEHNGEASASSVNIMTTANGSTALYRFPGSRVGGYSTTRLSLMYVDGATTPTTAYASPRTTVTASVANNYYPTEPRPLVRYVTITGKLVNSL